MNSDIYNRDMIDIMYSLGRSDALKLREQANGMTGTEIIACEVAVPAWLPDKDYSTWPAGSPVADEEQVWKLLQPHNASHYAGRPSTLRALWGLCHTKDPARAKPWVAPYGTSGMYMTDEVYKAKDGRVKRCKYDNVVHDADARPDAWEDVEVA